MSQEHLPLNEANRRRGTRKRLRGAIRVSCRKGKFGLGPNLARILWDISQTGACLIASNPLNKGDEVEILIESASFHQPLKIFAQVIWCEQLDDLQYSIGVSFQTPLPYMVISQVAQ